MAAHDKIGKARPIGRHQRAQGHGLGRGAGVLGPARLVDPADIADPEVTGVPAPDMRALERIGRVAWTEPSSSIT
jgi:hypothetical protein